MSNLSTVFKKNGTITAESNLGINDGTSFMVVASYSYVGAHQLVLMAEVIGGSQGIGVEKCIELANHVATVITLDMHHLLISQKNY